MAGASSIIMAGTSLVSAGMGVYKSAQGNKQMKEAQDKIDNYERQVLKNTLEGVATPQQMYNLENQQLQRSVANAQEAALQAGGRGLSSLTGIMGNEQEAQQRINANLENNLYQLNLAKAQEEQRIQQMMEERERQDLAGYGAMYEAGRQTKYSGIGDTIQSFQALGTNLATAMANKNQGQPAGGGNTVERQVVQPVTIQPSVNNVASVGGGVNMPLNTPTPYYLQAPGTGDIMPQMSLADPNDPSKGYVF